MKLTEKDLGSYLGCGVNYKIDDSHYETLGRHNISSVIFWEAKPIFRRLSTHLTQEITEGGETFVPINKISKMFSLDPMMILSRAPEEMYHAVVKQLQQWKFWTGDEACFDEGIILDNEDYDVYK